MNKDLATIVVSTCTDFLPYAESDSLKDHTRRGEVMEFVGLLKLCLNKAGITPKKLEKSVAGLSTGSGEASVEVEVKVTADKKKLFDLVHTREFQKTYLDEYKKTELDALFLSWGLEDPKRSESIKAQVRKEDLEQFKKDISKPVSELVRLVGGDMVKLSLLNVALLGGMHQENSDVAALDV